MISHIDITGVNIDLGDDIKKYVNKKISYLDKYLPKHARKTVHAEVKLRQTNNRLGNKYECEIIATLPEKQLIVKESTMNMFAAVDIVEQKLKNMFVKYKQEANAHLRPNVFSRFKARFLG